MDVKIELGRKIENERKNAPSVHFGVDGEWGGSISVDWFHISRVVPYQY